jgi:hypothetical protein
VARIEAFASDPPEQAVAPPLSDPTAAGARLGPEGLARLRSRHSEVLARISEKTTDPVRCEQLKTEAERLNPDTWVTDAEVVAGLEAYESVFESLRGVVGRRRKRRRRRSATGEEKASIGGDSGIAAENRETSAPESSGESHGAVEHADDPDDRDEREDDL